MTPQEKERIRQRDKARAWRAKPENAAKNRAHARAWELANPERVRARAKAYRERNREKIAAQKRRWREEHRHELSRLDQIKGRRQRYGLTHAEFEAMLARQRGKCAACSEPFTATPHVDHCHKTKKVRALLCRRCNLAVGFYEKYAQMVVAYLKLCSPQERAA